MIVGVNIELVCWEFCHGGSAVQQQLPQFFGVLSFLREAAGHANDGNCMLFIRWSLSMLVVIAR